MTNPEQAACGLASAPRAGRDVSCPRLGEVKYLAVRHAKFSNRSPPG